MGWEAWATLAIIAVTAVALARHVAGPDLILLGALALTVALGIVDPVAAVQGFGNAGLVTVAALFVVVAGLVQTGALRMFVQPLLGRPRTARRAQARLMLPVAGLSALVNNTPIVAMFLPVVTDWARKIGLSPSRLLMPLSYAAILGGTCTLIGTSTNLVINGLLLAEQPDDGLAFFELAWVGVPCAVVGVTYVLIAGKWLLPDRAPAFSEQDDPRQYTAEMIVDPQGPLVGQTIEQAGLRHLPGLYLAEIDRDGDVLPAVGPEQRIEANDRLVFVGVVESVVDLRKMPGLKPAGDQVFKLNAPATHRSLIEAVVSNSCPLVGRSIREGRFRSTYNAAVIAVARNGQRIVRQKIGDIVLQPGDTLLLEAHRSFAEQQRNNRHFYLVSSVADSAPPRHERAWVALAILVAMVVAVVAGFISMLGAALVAAAAMIATRCCSGTEARGSIDWTVLLVIGAALGLGRAMDTSGAAGGIANLLLQLAGENRWLTLVVIYALTMAFTAFITNNAAAVLVFPIAQQAAESLDASLMPFAVAIMLAASNDFATPIGYQTNLMVYTPGGYRFSDYLRLGAPLNGIVFAITVTLTPLVWPF
ncbi:MAG: SLC13 family permease [Phycisphaeraceae bacterium]